MSDIFDFYNSLYKLFDNVTPLKKDCGLLCSKACCKDTDEECGMLLFPFEEMIMKSVSYGRCDTTECEYGEDKNAYIFFCDKPCDRYTRPLACRIFPLMPYKKEGSPLKIIMNPAAKKICPLARSLSVSMLEPEFVRNVRKASNRILKLKDGEDYIQMLSEIADQFNEMNNIFK